MTASPCTLADVTADLNKAAFHPETMERHLTDALFDEEIRAFFAGAQTTLDHGTVARYANLFVATDTRLIHVYASDMPMPESDQEIHLQMQTVPLRAIASIDTVYGQSASGPGADELVMSIGWGGASRIVVDYGPCEDPECGSNHASGNAAYEDIVIRVSAEGDGRARLQAAIDFANGLRRAQLGAI